MSLKSGFTYLKVALAPNFPKGIEFLLYLKQGLTLQVYSRGLMISNWCIQKTEGSVRGRMIYGVHTSMVGLSLQNAVPTGRGV